MPPLERLESVDLHTQWADEAADFTPWVSSPEGLQMIGETLELELETLSSSFEVPVGRFRADVVCVDTNEPDDSLVLIENQLAPTNHEHVGQVLTYAAGLNAVTIIWIASKFRDEHLAVVEWLNQITNDRYRFFGLEIELVKIGESNPAAVFSVVAKPNDWSRGLRRRADSDRAISDLDRRHQEFWNQLRTHVEKNNIDIRLGNPNSQRWIGLKINFQGVGINAVRLIQPTLLRVEVHLHHQFHSAYFAALADQRSEIEADLGFELKWERKPTTSRIFTTTPKDPRHVDDWPSQIEWFADMLQKFDRAFRDRIQAVDPAEWSA